MRQSVERKNVENASTVAAWHRQYLYYNCTALNIWWANTRIRTLRKEMCCITPHFSISYKHSHSWHPLSPTPASRSGEEQCFSRLLHIHRFILSNAHIQRNITSSKTFLPHQEQHFFFPAYDRKWRFYILFSFLVLLLVMSRFAPAIPLASWQLNTKSMLLWLMRSASLISIRENSKTKLSWIRWNCAHILSTQRRRSFWVHPR